MTLQVGDRVEEQARSTDRHARAGVIREVVHEDPEPRYRIEWDDGHESVYTPAAERRAGAAGTPRQACTRSRGHHPTRCGSAAPGPRGRPRG